MTIQVSCLSRSRERVPDQIPTIHGVHLCGQDEVSLGPKLAARIRATEAIRRGEGECTRRSKRTMPHDDSSAGPSFSIQCILLTSLERALLEATDMVPSMACKVCTLL